MHTLRESLSSIPDAVNNIISNLPMPSTFSFNTENIIPVPPIEEPSSLSSTSGDDLSEKSQAIPSCLITEQWQLILEQDAPVDELEYAIERCKELVMNADECTYERKWLVRHLVELRFRLTEVKDVMENAEQNTESFKIILGHHFQNRTIRHPTTSRQYCDHCSGIIWSVVQASYICSDCQFCVHHKCVQNVLRVCSHVVATERKIHIADICPEVGLANQSYKCAECQTPFTFKGPFVEPRICDYTGLYYCPTCHWNDKAIIPARIVHNWDFTERRVCRASLQELLLTHERPVINLEYQNSKLFAYIHNLNVVQKLRENLQYMRKYLSECRLASAAKLMDHQIGGKRHLIQSPLMYSMADLIATENGNLIGFLTKICQAFDKHIRSCDICTGKGFICEICSNFEVIFPYNDGSVKCDVCKTVFHRACWLRKNLKCPKCLRIKERQLIAVNEEENDVNIEASTSGFQQN